MTTHYLPGVYTQFTGMVATSLAPTTLGVVVAPGRSGFSYTYDEPQGTGPTSIAVDPGANGIYHLTLNDGRTLFSPGDADVTMRQINWDDNGSPRSTFVLIIDGLFGASDTYSFRMGGDVLPAITSAADYNAFLGMITSQTDIPAGHPLAANMPISYAALPDVSSTENDDVFGTPGDDTIEGGPGYDYLEGWDGNDSIHVGFADPSVGYYTDKTVRPGTGNDTVNFGDTDNEFLYVGLRHSDLDAPVSVTIDGPANSGSINKGSNGTTSLINVQTPLNSNGLGIHGTEFDDTLNVTPTDGGWMRIEGEGGNDTINIGAHTGTVRLDYYDTRATTGIVADLQTGVIQDGRGGTDTVTGRASELRGTLHNDQMSGTDAAGQERFITLDGNDTVDGRGGLDIVRYDQGLFDTVTVDLAAGTASGTWDGAAFTDTLINIEGARGTYRGDDLLQGDAADNQFRGRGGNDTLRGLAGDDSLSGGDGNDFLFGGDGNDTAVGGDGQDVAYLNQGNDLFEDNAQSGDAGRDTVFAGYGDDTIEGGHGNDRFLGEWGNDLINAGMGDDRVFGGDGYDTITAGEGNDTVFGGNGRDLTYLNQGDDVFNDNGQGGVNGQDTVFAGWGNDTINGGNGNDVFHGENGNDRIDAKLGDDSIFGGDGFDSLFAGDGNDIVYGGNGRDLTYLGNGNDVFNDNGQGGVNGQDTVYGGNGDDTVHGGNGNDVFFGDAGNDVIRARLGNDIAYGGDNFDFIDMGDGNDTAYGGKGRDTVLLGNGDDRYVDTGQTGALGNDTITGGAGADTFVFGAVIAEDLITDFEIGTDTLEIAAALAGGRDAVQTVADLASVVGGDVVIEFAAGQTITLQGLTSTAGLDSDLLLV